MTMMKKSDDILYKSKTPYNKKEYTLVIVYGLSDEHPMKLLTNLKYAEKEEVIKIVRLYLSRWKIEEHFRGKKQEYNFENMRVITLKSMNSLNMMPYNTFRIYGNVK